MPRCPPKTRPSTADFDVMQSKAPVRVPDEPAKPEVSASLPDEIVSAGKLKLRSFLGRLQVEWKFYKRFRPSP
jgi:hypothetical protein